MPNIIPFHFGTQEVRVELDEQDQPWWIAKDVCTILGLEQVNRALARLKPHEKGDTLIMTHGGMQAMRTVSESGLYRLIFRSDKPEAQAFQSWVFEEVLPSIRKTGKYEAPVSDGDALVQMAIAYREQQKQLRAIEDQQRDDQKAIIKAQQDMLILQKEMLETKDQALLAIHSMQWVTIRQYVEIYGMQRQMASSVQKSYATWLNTYCLERNHAMYKAATAGKDWPYEKTYCIAVINETLPGWLKRYGGSDQEELGGPGA